MTFEKSIKMAWTKIVLLMLLVFNEAIAQDFTKTECLSGKEETTPKRIEFQCPPNTIIAIGEAIYGRNKWGSCTYTVGDCTDKIDIFQPCQDKEKCSIELTKTYSPKCGGYATFLRVLYDCEYVLKMTPMRIGLSEPPPLTGIFMDNSLPITDLLDPPTSGIASEIFLFDIPLGQSVAGILIISTLLNPFYPVLPTCLLKGVTEAREYIPSTPSERKLWTPPVAIRDDDPSKTPDQATNPEEVGLIAGCVVAVIITTIMLLFAIYLVIKRLVKSPHDNEEKGPDGQPLPKPDIVIFDFCFCGGSTHADKPRPVADQNQNIRSAAPLRITDRPVPIGEVTVENVTEFRHENEEAPMPTSTSVPPYTVVEASSPSVLAEAQSQRIPQRQRPQNTVETSNTAVGLPNTVSVTIC